MVHDAPPWRDHSPFPNDPNFLCPGCDARPHAAPSTLVLSADIHGRIADDLAPVLLVTLVELTDRDTSAMITLAGGTSSRPALEAISLLLGAGDIKVASTIGATAVQVTPAGLQHADRIERERASHGARRAFALDELVAAAFAGPDERVDLQAFTARTFHLGEHLDASTVIAAARDLVSYGLAVPIPPEGERPEQLALTRSGWHCAALDMKVIQYVTQHNVGNGPASTSTSSPGVQAPKACMSPRPTASAPATSASSSNSCAAPPPAPARPGTSTWPISPPSKTPTPPARPAGAPCCGCGPSWNRPAQPPASSRLPSPSQP
ncbi:hypothetical protein PV721_32380 [Streptomyces sp. MB09-01]|uniref:hypothetical protein n=1 Tax=Streptomyces sp. MB09-01 TaxID=3028666 RepID=UPI0029A20DD6|nr:hypothetical protein [Streptomyces sp. MB09-01]MDX3538954.1 hypothetical protein [Streptomyces sp. MB09-01]